MNRGIAVSWLSALCLVGCARDSAVGNMESQEAFEIAGWKVSSEPVVRLGGNAAIGEDEFTNVEWATRLSNGEILVLEQASAELGASAITCSAPTSGHTTRGVSSSRSSRSKRWKESPTPRRSWRYQGSA